MKKVLFGRNSDYTDEELNLIKVPDGVEVLFQIYRALKLDLLCLYFNASLSAS